jgi:hypothetical protein
MHPRRNVVDGIAEQPREKNGTPHQRAS